MGWDDIAPEQEAAAPAAATAGSWDAAPPAPGFLERTASNIMPDLKDVGQNLESLVKGPALDIASGDVASAIPKLVHQGEAMAANPKGTFDAMAAPIAHPVDYFEKHPVQQTMNVAGLLAGAGELGAEGAAEEAAANVPHGAIPPEPPAAPVPPAAPRAPAELPTMTPGAKTGDPHALFAYNDKFGPGGTERSIYNVFGDPEHPAIQAAGGHGSSVPKATLDKAGIPVVGREPRSVGKWEPIVDNGKPDLVALPKDAPGTPPSRLPPDPNAPKPTPPAATGTPPDPFKDIRDFVNSKYQKMEKQGGWPDRLANYLREESNKLGAKDLGLQGRQVQTMGQGYEGLEKANALVDYARQKGYMEPTLSDSTRRSLIKFNMDKAGENLNAVRSIAEKRGAPPLEDIKAQVLQELQAKYGAGVEKAPTEIANVMDDIQKAKPTFTGMADLATKLNKSATKVKDLGQHPGPTTDAANIVSRMNNDAIRGVLNPQESELYTQSLRDYGAHKKLEQATAGAGRRELTARSNQRGPVGRMVQEALDRGGYRMAGNVAKKMSDVVLKNPGKIKTLPQFFEELAHQSNEELDNALDIQHMAKGGVVPHDVKQWIAARGC